jgi:signal transduction histidine kinase
MAQEADRDITLAGLVHDLNNVLETISEAAELIEGPEGCQEIAATIRRSVARGRRITGSIVRQARAPVGAQEPMEWAAGFVRDLAKLVHSARFSVTVDADPEILLPGEASDWERVFMNLFLNAMQATKGAGKVVARARRDGDQYSISVADNGPGIPEELIGKVLRSRVSTRGAQGGLGLSIVKAIVVSHAGTVEVHNQASGGAVFLIQLPVC